MKRRYPWGRSRAFNFRLTSIFVFGMINLALAQRQDFLPNEYSPNLLSAKIYQISQSKSRPDALLQTREWDRKNGRHEQIRYSAYSNHVEYHERQLITKEKTTKFECECRDIDAFINAFKVRSKEELKNEPSGYVAEPPSKFVTITSEIKKERTKTIEVFSESGFRLSNTIAVYDAKGRLLSEKRFGFEEELVYAEQNEYDRKGRLSRRLISKPDRQSGTYANSFTYTKTATLNLEVNNEDSLWIIWQKEPHPRGYLLKTITTKGNEQKLQKLEIEDVHGRLLYVEYFGGQPVPYAKHEFAYSKKGLLLSMVSYNKQSEVTERKTYTYDKKGHWTEFVKEYPIIVQEGKAQRNEWRVDKFRQELIYR